LKKISKYVKQNEISLIHAHITTPAGIIAYFVKRELSIPFIIHVHGRDIQQFHTFAGEEKYTIKMVFEAADGIICNSSKTYHLVNKIINGYDKCVVLPFGIDIDKNVNKKNIVKNNFINIVSVSNLVAVKSIDKVLQAINNSKHKENIRYHIIGDGPELKKLKGLTAKLNLSQNVFFMGRVPNKEVRGLLESYDFFVLPSINEAFGVAYLEALAAGLPCVAVEKQGCIDIDDEEKCILTVKPNDIDEIRSKIDYLIENPKVRSSMAEYGKNKIQTKFAWSNIINQYDKFYNSIIISREE
jgi:glycosyltransferase involved in cell wall biosynthesis